MEFGIFGLELSGKTTLFSLLTGHDAAAATHKREAHVGIAHVPDPRLDRLTAMFKPKKHTPATVRFVDVPGVVKGGAQSLNLPELRQMDGLAVVVRGFTSDAVPHPEGSIDPARDLELLETEMLLSDLSVVTNRLDRVAKDIMKKKSPELEAERELLTRYKATLEKGDALRAFDPTPDELKLIRGFGLLTLKPMLVILNADEKDAGDLAGALARATFDKWKGQPRVGFSAVSATIEQEIAAMSPEDQAEFLKGLGLPDRALDRLLRAAYELLGLVSFLTAGEDECRAWSIPRGTHAVKAAGVIHTDFERTFIRAEVVPFEKLMEAGSLAACRTHGSFRLEGKDYVVQDGDVINFRVGAQ
ncbi:MAG TPA: redox-regulated ATPase YchF [Thermoanaerobaculia bacterium]|nr:redox-regulated ATPase YchF [Thermoanaerobaculia bacterium]HQR66783.1 redox-regulated ATPase YchF [Thermoanaerobaculia bacterium]